MPRLLLLQVDQGLLLICAQSLFVVQLDGVQLCCVLSLIPSQLYQCIMLLGCLLLNKAACYVWVL